MFLITDRYFTHFINGEVGYKVCLFGTPPQYLKRRICDTLALKTSHKALAYEDISYAVVVE